MRIYLLPTEKSLVHVLRSTWTGTFKAEEDEFELEVELELLVEEIIEQIGTIRMMT